MLDFYFVTVTRVLVASIQIRFKLSAITHTLPCGCDLPRSATKFERIMYHNIVDEAELQMCRVRSIQYTLDTKLVVIL